MPPQRPDTGVPRVVVIGAGFGGLQCARSLSGAPVEVVVLDRNNYHLFTPLVYQVASSLLNPSDIAYPVRSVFRGARNVRFRAAEVVGIDVPEQEVLVEDGPPERFDYLVLATGAVINHFGLDSVAAVAHNLTKLPDALRLRDHVLRCFEAASATSAGQRAPWITFVIVGGGPTGVEYAGALAEFIRKPIKRDFPELRGSAIRVVLVEGRATLLPAFPASLGEHARARLERLGVEVVTGAQVERADTRGVVLSTGSEIPARTLVWAAGVKPAALETGTRLPRRPSGRIAVDASLRLEGRPNLFAVGDVAGFQVDGEELAMLAAPAIQQGRHVGRSIRRLVSGSQPEPFRYRDLGIMATIGRNAGVAVLGGLKLRGFFGWWAWLVVHLLNIIGFRNRAAVLLEWGWDYLFYDRPIRFVVHASRTTVGGVPAMSKDPEPPGPA